ncbi:adenylyl-sulfate kinase [Clavibacter sp. VKM Ac-2542]|uniref:adenylyl-sulfate kinase n=1 Tax=Clavibacter sp. VKM Ac-2542 TaxID=2783811 RepID=UPI001889CDFB|nr:adenylyl-sulfate kinase [Clavibacter sp. VKM Ac-2542]MBF4621244.1 adenylyl-sulfate kinase [Clavibacter sp. VKM Ac-2542]
MDSGSPTQALFLGGRSGVGKTTVALEVSRILTAADVAHALIEGDGLDQAHPEPWRHGIPLAERNLATMWRNYRDAGWTRVIYTNTVSVLELHALTAALGGEVEAVGVLLTASDATAAGRLAGREIGSGLAEAIGRSAAAAPRLEAGAGGSVHRVATDGRTVAEIAAEVVALSGWIPVESR